MHIPNFDIISQERKRNKRNGGVLIYIHQILTCNLNLDLCASDKDKEILTIDKYRHRSCCYRPPNGDSENVRVFLQNRIIDKSVSEKKFNYIIGNFTMNCLRYLDENAKTKHFYDIPIINCPTGISEHLASLIDNILTTDIFNSSLKKGII